MPFLAFLLLLAANTVSKAFIDKPVFGYLLYGLALCLFLAWVYLDRKRLKSVFSKKSLKYGGSSGLLLVIVLSSLVGIAYVTDRDTFNKKLDLTKNEISSLSGSSLDTIEKLVESESEVKMTGYFYDGEQKKEFQRIIGLYVAQGAKIQLEFVNPSVNPQKVIAAKIQDPNTVIITLNQRESRVTTFTEEELTNALININKDGSKVVYFTTDHGESTLDSSEAKGLNLAKQMFTNQKYELKELSIINSGALPEDADLIVISGPAYDFQPGETELLTGYLKAGGSVLLLVDPVTQFPTLKDFTKSFGVEINDDLLILSDKDPIAMFLGQNTAVVSEFDSSNPMTRGFSGSGGRGSSTLMMPNARSLSVVDEGGASAKLLAKTPDGRVASLQGVQTAEDLKGEVGQDRLKGGEHGVFAYADIVVESSDAESTASTKSGQLAVLGSSFMIKNQAMKTSPENREFVGGVVSFLSRDENFVSIPNKEFEKGNIDLTSASSVFFKSFLVFIYPLLFLAITLVYWLIRRRKAA